MHWADSRSRFLRRFMSYLNGSLHYLKNALGATINVFRNGIRSFRPHSLYIGPINTIIILSVLLRLVRASASVLPIFNRLHLERM